MSLNIIQIIENAHNGFIYYIDITDDNNFVICSEHDFKLSQKVNILNKNEFIINKIIDNAHTNSIQKYYINQMEILFPVQEIIQLKFGKRKKIIIIKINIFYIIKIKFILFYF